MTSTTTHLRYDQLAPIAELDRTIFGSSDPFTLAADERTAVLLEAIREWLEAQLATGSAYASLLDCAGVSADEVGALDALDRIPLLPSGVFKRAGSPFGGAPSPSTRRCASSGTQGTLSVIWRDRTTIERLLGSVRAGIGLIDDWDEEDVQVLNLGPDREEAGDLWFAYVMSLVELVFPTEHCVVDDTIDHGGVLARLREELDHGFDVGVVGPPALVAELCETALATDPLPTQERLTIVTAGGWKRASGLALERPAFDNLVMRALGVSDIRRIRDAFNQVELNSVLFECEARRKHIPPWVHVTAREPRELRPLPSGTPGLLAYIDASAGSYPCAFVGDDVGCVADGPCECGRAGPTMEVLRRVERSETWGCALKMDRDVTR